MTPNDIEVLIHCYGSRAIHPRLDAPAVRDAIDRFLELGLIAKCEAVDVFVPTKGGELLVDMLCRTPYPEHKWVDPRHESSVK